MSMIPCSAAPRRTVCSSSTSISMPTGSNRTTCRSAMDASARSGREGGAGGAAAGLLRLLLRVLRVGGSAVCRSRPARGATADVVGVERLLLLGGHLVEQHVGALQRRHPAKVVQVPHLLRVQVQ